MIDYELLNNVIEYNKTKYFNYKNGVYYEPNLIYEKILKARYNKITRIKQHFVYLLARYNYIYFVTFTLNDTLLDFSEKWRRKIIQNVLSSFDPAIKYILNPDFGSKHERLHYHCIVATNSDSNLSSFLKINYPSFSYVEPVITSNVDLIRTSKYLNKLTNHTSKTSTHNKRVYYNFKDYPLSPTSYDKRIFYLYDLIQLSIL